MAQFRPFHSFAGGPCKAMGLHLADGSDLRTEILEPRPQRVDDLTKSAFAKRPDLHIETEGEFAGWRTWRRDNFETHNGPFWHRIEDDGQIRCAFRVEKKHLNGSQHNVHGGAFMAFADYCLFAIAGPVLHGPAVTVSFGCEFLDAAQEGELVEGTGEITRAGSSMIFLRGLLKSGERTLFSFSGTIKRVRRRTPPAASNDTH